MADAAGGVKRTIIDIAGAKLELNEAGKGPPVLFLHGGNGPMPQAPFFARLAARHRVIMPTHPGFGTSELPDWLDCPDDIAHIYLELMDRLQLDKPALIGGSIGGWISAEIATKAPERLSRLVLIGAVGIKVGPADRLDIPDMFALPPAKLAAMLWHDPAKHRVDFAKLGDEQLLAAVRARETLALLAWEPYMHNPKLRHRLHRISTPTLLMRGESDGLVSADYTAAYARLIPGASVKTIAAAGHVPHIEQPEASAAAVIEFMAR